MQPWRRAEGLKRVRRVLRIWRGGWQDIIGDGFYEEGGPLEQAMFANRKMCSCPMCGNPRKWNSRRSYHERQADEAFKQQMREIAHVRR